MWRRFLWENLEMVLIALLIVIPVRSFVIQPFIVHGSSMEPNFYSQDYLVIDELSYKFKLRNPQRYEVIVFRAPNFPSQFYIKRIIGLPGETVEISNGKVFIISKNNQKVALKENYLPPSTVTSGHLTIHLEDNQYFVLGDNRSASYDSRNWGPVDRNLIIGRVWLRLWPPERIRAFNYSPS